MPLQNDSGNPTALIHCAPSPEITLAQVQKRCTSKYPTVTFRHLLRHGVKLGVGGPLPVSS